MMKLKILLLLLVLGISFLSFGCVKKGGETPEEEENETEEDEEEETEDEEEELSEEDEELADLFEIDTDEPVGDTGLDGVSTPSSEKEQNTS